MNRVTFNIAARCEAAGRAANQDNYWLNADLTQKVDTITPASVNKDGDVELGRAGALLVVADGMGGMNAGEKASELVVAGIKRAFSRVPASILDNEGAVKEFIRKAILSADADVKEYARQHREAEGLGSTIVLLWLLGSKAYCGWVGDSRIYCFNPNNSLVRLSHDHSYVQSLVDEGKISEEEAFDHPDGNIIQQSLGDSGEVPVPEVKVYDIHERDVFMLCSDGLCGLIPDNEIEDLISVNCTSSKDALDALWKAGEKAGFTDNCTIEIAAVSEAPVRPAGIAQGYPVAKKARPAAAKKDSSAAEKSKTEISSGTAAPNTSRGKLIGVIVAVVAVIAGLGGWWFFSKSSGSGGEQTEAGQTKVFNADKGIWETVDVPDDGNGTFEDDGRPVATADKGKKPTAADKKQKDSEGPKASEGSGKPDAGYISLLNNMRRDYGSARSTWSAVNRAGRMSPAQKRQLESFCANARQLSAGAGRYDLTPDQKSLVNNVTALANQIGARISSFDKDEEPALPKKKFQPKEEEKQPEHKQPEGVPA